MAIASPPPDGLVLRTASQAATLLPLLVALITRGMTTLSRAKRTSRIVSFLMVICIIGRISRSTLFKRSGFPSKKSPAPLIRLQGPSELIRSEIPGKADSSTQEDRSRTRTDGRHYSLRFGDQVSIEAFQYRMAGRPRVGSEETTFLKINGVNYQNRPSRDFLNYRRSAA
jgi:hypothetical protein